MQKGTLRLVWQATLVYLVYSLVNVCPLSQPLPENPGLTCTFAHTAYNDAVVPVYNTYIFPHTNQYVQTYWDPLCVKVEPALLYAQKHLNTVREIAAPHVELAGDKLQAQYKQTLEPHINHLLEVLQYHYQRSLKPYHDAITASYIRLQASAAPYYARALELGVQAKNTFVSKAVPALVRSKQVYLEYAHPQVIKAAKFGEFHLRQLLFKLQLYCRTHVLTWIDLFYQARIVPQITKIKTRAEFYLSKSTSTRTPTTAATSPEGTPLYKGDNNDHIIETTQTPSVTDTLRPEAPIETFNSASTEDVEPQIVRKTRIKTVVSEVSEMPVEPEMTVQPVDVEPEMTIQPVDVEPEMTIQPIKPNPAKQGWVEKVKRTVKGALKNLDADADAELEKLAKEYQPKFQDTLRKIVVFGNDVSPGAAELVSKVEQNPLSIPDEEVHEFFAEKHKALMAILDEVKQIALELAKLSVERVSSLQQATLEALDDFFDVILLEAGRETAGSNDSDDWARWKEYNNLKKLMTTSRQEVAAHDPPSQHVKHALRESQEIGVNLAGEIVKHFNGLRAKCQYLIQQAHVEQEEEIPIEELLHRQKREAKKAKKLNVDKEPVQDSVEEAPVVEEKEAPVVEEKEIPVVGESEIPVVEETEIPVVEETEIPVVEETEIPVVEESEIPVVEKETPVIEESETPVVEEKETILVSEAPDSLANSKESVDVLSSMSEPEPSQESNGEDQSEETPSTAPVASEISSKPEEIVSGPSSSEPVVALNQGDDVESVPEKDESSTLEEISVNVSEDTNESPLSEIKPASESNAPSVEESQSLHEGVAESLPSDELSVELDNESTAPPVKVNSAE